MFSDVILLDCFDIVLCFIVYNFGNILQKGSFVNLVIMSLQ